MRIRRISPVARLVRLGALMTALIVVFVASLVLVYALPQSTLKRNASVSSAMLVKDGPAPFIMLKGAVPQQQAITLDNFTDALMLLTSVAVRPTPLESAMSMDIGTLEGETTFDPARVLGVRAEGGSEKLISYSRYWHGYQIFLRPLLMVANYEEIRYVNMIALGVLALVTILSLQRRAGTIVAGSLFGALLLTGDGIVPLSLQYSNMTYLALFAALAASAVAARRDLERLDLEFFLVLGAVTAFFDLLTTPALPLGVALVVILEMRRARKGHTARRGLILTARALAAWGAGYILSWGTKWLLAAAILRQSIAQEILGVVEFRTGLDGGGFQFGSAIKTNIFAILRPALIADMLSHGAASVALVVALAAVALAAFLALRPRLRSRRQLLTGLPVLVVACLPYVWYLALNQHSALHSYITYRLQAVTLFAVSCFVLGALTLAGRARDASSPEATQPADPRGPAERAAVTLAPGSGAEPEEDSAAV